MVELFVTATNVLVGAALGNTAIVYVSAVADVLVTLIDLTNVDVEFGTV